MPSACRIPGAEHVVKKILPTLDFSETRFFANVSGSTIEEYAEVTRRFDDSPIDAIEINISCPNVKEGGVAFGNYPDMSAKVVEACRKATNKPIITKLSPNQTDIKENARRCIEAGSDGLAVINTIMGMAIDVKSRRPVIGNVQGGLSGPAIKPIALLKVHQVYEVAKKAQRADHRPGWHHDGERCARIHDCGRHDGGPGDCAFLRSASVPQDQCRRGGLSRLNNLRGISRAGWLTAHGLTGHSVRTQRVIRQSILAPARNRIAPDDCSGGEDSHDDQNDVRRVVIARALNHDLGVLRCLNDYFLHVSSLRRTVKICPEP